MKGTRHRVARACALGATFVGVTTSAGGSWAEAPQQAETPEKPVEWLRWTPPPECPGQDFVLERVQSWFGGRMPATRDLDARGEVNCAGTHWEVTVALRVDDTKGERRVRVATCADAAEFLAVTIVLAVDPSRAPDLPTVVAEAEVPPEEEPPVPPVERKQAPVPPGQANTALPERAPEPQRSWFLGVAAEGAAGPLPSFQVGPLIEAGLERGPAVLGVGVHFLPSVAQLPSGAVAEISYGLAAGRLNACVLAPLGPFDLGPCADLDVGALWTNQGPPGDVAQLVPWVDLQIGAMARLFGPQASLVLGSRLSVPLTQPRFVVSSGALAHQPTVGVVLDLGVQFFFGKR